MASPSSLDEEEEDWELRPFSGFLLKRKQFDEETNGSKTPVGSSAAPAHPLPCSASESELSEDEDEDDEEDDDDEDEDDEEELELLLLLAFSFPFTAASFLVAGGDCFPSRPAVGCLPSDWLTAGDLLMAS